MPRRRKERDPDAPRKIPISDPQKRQRWKPGDEHPLDVMVEEAHSLEQELQEAILRVQQGSERVQMLMGKWEDVTAKEREAQQVFAERFERVKHAEHLQATLAVLRRRRLLARLQALEEVLLLASLLELDIFRDGFLQDLYDTLNEEQRQQMKLLGDVRRSRQQLSSAEGHLSRIRQLLTVANGYFETYVIPKRSVPAALMSLLDAIQLHKEGQPIPENMIASVPEDVQETLRALKPGDHLPEDVLEVAQLAYWGPYLKYRWREGSTGPLYTIALGKIFPSDGTEAADEADKPEEFS
jgi:hypothetical protein